MDANSRPSIVGCAAWLGGALLLLVWLLYRGSTARWEEISGTSGLLGFLLFVVVAFVVPLSLGALLRAASLRLVRTLPLQSVLPVGGIILSAWLGTDLLRAFLEDAPKIWQLVGMVSTVGVKLGVLFGALEAAKAVWSREPQASRPNRRM